MSIIICILKISIMFIAAYLAWECNKKSNLFLRFFYTLFASFFSIIYIIYYFIYHSLMGYKCYENIVLVAGTSAITSTI